MNRDTRTLLADVARAGQDIQSFTEGMERATYLRDGMTQAAVERKFEIIGEALNRMQKALSELAERTPRFHRIIAFQNSLIHGYASVILEHVWGHAYNHIRDYAE